MGLPIIRRDGRTGEIILVDEREDGTTIVLLCRPFEEDPDGAVAIPPQRRPPPDRGGFPWLDRLLGRPERGLEDKPFQLALDTTRLRPGSAVFTTARFIEKALETVDRGVQEIPLTPERAKDWGYVESAGLKE